jgi:hypothetical protein
MLQIDCLLLFTFSTGEEVVKEQKAILLILVLLIGLLRSKKGCFGWLPAM